MKRRVPARFSVQRTTHCYVPGIGLVFCLFQIAVANALYVSLDTSNPASPANFSYAQSGNLSFTKIFAFANTSGMSESLLSWQLELRLHPLNGAVGQLHFTEYQTPPDSLFGPPGPFAIFTPPSPDMVAFDAYSNPNDFDGAPIPAGEYRNVLQVKIAASSDANGDFEVVMGGFTPPDLGSSWFPADTFQPIAFENSASSSEAGFIRLATVHISSSYPPGDYNHDHQVNELDCQLWAGSFGNTVSAGSGADGNGNGIVDAADYVICRHNAAGAGARLNDAQVPEPVFGSALAILAVLGLSTIRVRNRHN